MTWLHLRSAEHLSHGCGNTPKRLPGTGNAFHLVKCLRLRPHKAGEDEWETEVHFAFSTQSCEWSASGMERFGCSFDYCAKASVTCGVGESIWPEEILEPD